MSDNKIISLDQFREKKNKSREENFFLGTLVWLYCPKCESLEYTEVLASEGRYHNICGSLVKEAEVEVDLRAEVTIAKYNIKKLNELIANADFFKKKLLAMKNHEEIYIKRLYMAAGSKIARYTEDIEKIKGRLPIKKTHMGLLISDFRFQPEKRFSMK